MREQIEPDFRQIERDRDLPPDELYGVEEDRDDEPYDHDEEADPDVT